VALELIGDTAIHSVFLTPTPSMIDLSFSPPPFRPQFLGNMLRGVLGGVHYGAVYRELLPGEAGPGAATAEKVGEAGGDGVGERRRRRRIRRPAAVGELRGAVSETARRCRGTGVSSSCFGHGRSVRKPFLATEYDEFGCRRRRTTILTGQNQYRRAKAAKDEPPSQL